MAIFHRYFTRRHLRLGMKGDTNLAGRTEEDFVILRVCVSGVWGEYYNCQECGCMNSSQTHICQQPGAAQATLPSFSMSIHPPLPSRVLKDWKKS